MRTLTIDIETSPHLAHVWGMWQNNVSLNQLMESGEVICFAAKWLGKKEIIFRSVHHDGKEEMVRAAHELFDQADVLIHYNGDRFDIPHLNREFLEAGLAPPAPFHSVDLLRTVKKQFRFPSNKLDYVVQTLDIGAKATHTGHTLWVQCMAGDNKAWNLMRKYNKQDVVVTEKLFERLGPWIKNAPVAALYDQEASEDRCPACGSYELKPRGYTYTKMSKYQRYVCECGKWSRSNKRSDYTNLMGI